MMKRKMLKAMFLCILMVVSSSLFAQNIVTGSVKDDTGQTLPGVSVVVKGSTAGTVTDIDGKFSLQAPANGTLVFSFVGMQSKEVNIAGQRKINVQPYSYRLKLLSWRNHHKSCCRNAFQIRHTPVSRRA